MGVVDIATLQTGKQHVKQRIIKKNKNNSKLSSCFGQKILFDSQQNQKSTLKKKETTKKRRHQLHRNPVRTPLSLPQKKTHSHTHLD